MALIKHSAFTSDSTASPPSLLAPTSGVWTTHHRSYTRPLKTITLIGGGATAVYLANQFRISGNKDFILNVIDLSTSLGAGMPYSNQWVGEEHLANIACGEIPDLIDSPHQWLRDKSDQWLKEQGVKREDICEHYLLPRVILGMFLEDQFNKIKKLVDEAGIKINILTNTKVTDIEDLSTKNQVRLQLETSGEKSERSITVDKVVIATGHEWPQNEDGQTSQYFTSPWPASKIQATYNHPVGLLGSSLTAVDVVMTLAKNHGSFSRDDAGNLQYTPNPGTENFKIVLHSRRGLLPSQRFHFEYPKIQTHQYISKNEVERHIQANKGYLSLDFMFEHVYKNALQTKDHTLYSEVKNQSLEAFVAWMYEKRQSRDPFELFQDEYRSSQQSLRDHQPIYWKEILDDVVYTINFHAKNLSAEDMIRLKQVLMPLVSHVVAFLPLQSTEKILSLHSAGKLEIKAIGRTYSITANSTLQGTNLRFNTSVNGDETNLHYNTFINCLGQREMPFTAFPFDTLIKQNVVSPAKFRFRSSYTAENEWPATRPGEPKKIHKVGNSYFLQTSGIAVDDLFRPVNENGQPNQKSPC